MTEKDTPRIAVIGAGAIADIFHLPALARRPGLRDRLIVVDRDAERARATAAKHGVTRHAADYRQILGEIDGAVIALPHRLHVPVSRDCLARGVHVLCEKPLAETAAEADELVRAAQAANVTLSVNNTRRLYPSTQAVRQLIAGGLYGEVMAIDFAEGAPFEWPAVGDGYFGVKAGGRGVLADVGAHVVDLVCWWLGGKPDLVRYEDDCFGGTEATCEVTLKAGSAEARIRLSWLAKLRNTYRVCFSSGYSIEHGIYDQRNPTLVAPSGHRSTIKTPSGPATHTGFADLLVDNFVAVIERRAEPLISARAVIPSIAVIEACYAHRKRFSMPWFDLAAVQAPRQIRTLVKNLRPVEAR